MVALASLFCEPVAALVKKEIKYQSMGTLLNSQQPVQTLVQLDDMMKLDAKLR